MARPRQADPGGASPAGAPVQARGAEAGAPAGFATSGAPGARLATNQLKRMRRIVDAAVELAEQGGFEAVRLRDVAERSDVALGTLYKYFRSKEDILLFALDEEVDRLEQAMAVRPPAGATPAARAVDFFRRVTRGLARRAPFSHAMMRALTGSDQELALKVAAFQLRVARLVGAALRGEPPDLGAPLDRALSDPSENEVAVTLMNVWYAAMVGWAAGLHAERGVTEHVRVAARLVLGGGRAA
jgi:AcrR family transcriptional regulator